MRKLLVFLNALLVLASHLGAVAAEPPVGEHGRVPLLESRAFLPLIMRTGPPAASQSLEYGVNFISAAGAPADEARYQNAIATGTDLNRWPFYWYSVETSAGVFDWSQADSVVAADLAHGLQTQLILMGTPGFYSSGKAVVQTIPPYPSGRYSTGWWPAVDGRAPASPASPPTNLNAPIFSDGTDLPGPGKTINPDNYWARFVHAAVSRYSAMGITQWEVWNEQDYSFFWSGTAGEYARLLKVAYLAAKQANPAAQISLGGLANFEKPGFLADVMATLNGDAMAPSYDFFFDLLATHSYSYAWESWYHVWRAGKTLGNYGLDKPIWLNESGTPAWDDYPGPTWDPNSGFRSSMLEGAAYVIQSAMYAKYAGADVVFHFQLYDDCGNCPAGSDFPPNDGSICDPNNVCGTCAGDAFGLITNPRDAACFTQHPNPETARPVLNAYQVLTTHLRGLEPLWRMRPGGTDPYNGPQEWIAFYRPATRQRVLGLWARFGTDETALVPATGASAQLIDQAGNVTTLTPAGDSYSLTLDQATNQNLPYAPTTYAIGGPPLILVETDTRPPIVTATVPAISTPAIQVQWSGEDLGSGLLDYDVWVSVDGGPLTLWLQDTTSTSDTYLGLDGHTYGFAAAGRDRAGNQGSVPTNPQAVTFVGGQLIYLPVIMRGIE